MLQSEQNRPRASAPLPANPRDRRAHPRIPSEKLPVTRVHIPHRATVSLVDLSSGGALLELPFQMQPDTRFAVKLDTAVEQVEMPFQLLRCYVAELRGGVTYHAAGAFDSLLNLRDLAQRASCSVKRLRGSLDQLQRSAQKASAQSRSEAQFNEILGGAIAWLAKGESLDLVTLKVKAHLTQTYPALMIAEKALPLRDQLTSVQGFGMTFTSRYTLSAHDRRYLRSAAQLLSMLESARRETRDEVEESSDVIYSAADWMSTPPRSWNDQDLPKPANKPRLKTPAPVDHDNWTAIESLIRKAAVL